MGWALTYSPWRASTLAGTGQETQNIAGWEGPWTEGGWDVLDPPECYRLAGPECDYLGHQSLGWAKFGSRCYELGWAMCRFVGPSILYKFTL